MQSALFPIVCLPLTEGKAPLCGVSRRAGDAVATAGTIPIRAGTLVEAPFCGCFQDISCFVLPTGICTRCCHDVTPVDIEIRETLNCFRLPIERTVSRRSSDIHGSENTPDSAPALPVNYLLISGIPFRRMHRAGVPSGFREEETTSCRKNVQDAS